MSVPCSTCAKHGCHDVRHRAKEIVLMVRESAHGVALPDKVEMEALVGEVEKLLTFDDPPMETLVVEAAPLTVMRNGKVERVVARRVGDTVQVRADVLLPFLKYVRKLFQKVQGTDRNGLSRYMDPEDFELNIRTRGFTPEDFNALQSLANTMGTDLGEALDVVDTPQMTRQPGALNPYRRLGVESGRISTEAPSISTAPVHVEKKMDPNAIFEEPNVKMFVAACESRKARRDAAHGTRNIQSGGSEGDSGDGRSDSGGSTGVRQPAVGPDKPDR